jgi:hypothetical protein
MYSISDVNLLEKNWDSITQEILEQKYILMEPSLEEKKQVHSIILNYIIDNKRKVYGGFCLYELIKLKNINDAYQIYKPNMIPDIDFYSPDPMTDIISICDILYKKGYKHVISREALHHETYNISVNCVNYCDITYVPKNIYNKIPFRENNGIMLTHPHFLVIDYLRIMNDPQNSYWKFDNDLKPFKRYLLLQKYYPMPQLTSDTMNIIFECGTSDIEAALNNIFEFLLDNKEVIVLGFYNYNYFVMINNRKDHTTTNVPYYEFISVNYRETCLTLLDKLRKIYGARITHTEMNPFFQFTGFSTEIYLDDDFITRIYCNNDMCIPYQDVIAYKFINNRFLKLSNNIRIAPFLLTLMYGFITIMRARVCNDEYTKKLYYSLISHLLNMRNYYYVTYKKTFIDNTIYKEFITTCIGKGIRPEQMRKLLIENRKKNNKRLTFTYEPSNAIDDEKKDIITSYIFTNTSGNIITNEKNLKLIIVNKEIISETDEKHII